MSAPNAGGRKPSSRKRHAIALGYISALGGLIAAFSGMIASVSGFLELFMR